MPVKRERRLILAGLVMAGLVVAGFVLWLSRSEPLALKADLRTVVPKTLELTFLLMVAGLLASFRSVRASLRSAPWLPFAVFAGAFLTVSIVPPSTHRIYYDEDIYENVAQNIVWSGRAQMCNEGTLDSGTYSCDGWEYNKEPNAFPFLLSLAFRVTGADETWAHRVNHAVLALGALSVYWLAGMLFARTSVALFAALVYVLTPESLLWGATVAVEPGASSFGVLGLAAFVLFCQKPSWATAVFGASALAFACQFRPESGLVLAAAAAAAVLLSPGLLLRRELGGAALVVLLLLLPHLAHLWVVRHEKWGSNEAKFSLDYVKGNSRTNLGYYVEGREFPPWYTLAAMLGLFYPRRRREAALLGIAFVLLFGIFIPFYAGSYRYGADIRFALVSAAPLAILAGAGFALAAEWLRRILGLRRAAVILAGLLVYGFTHYLPHTRAVGREAWQARDDHAFARRIVDELPRHAVVLTHNPGMFHVMGQSAVQTSLATYQLPRVDRLFHEFPGGVYFHYNFWCNVADPVQNAFCTEVLKTFGTQVLREETSGFYRYVLYRLLPRSAPLEPPPG